MCVVNAARSHFNVDRVATSTTITSTRSCVWNVDTADSQTLRTRSRVDVRRGYVRACSVRAQRTHSCHLPQPITSNTGT